VWNLLGGFCTHVLRGHHQRPVRYVSFCPSKLLLVSADDEGGLCAWTLHPSTGNNSNKKKQNNVDAHPLVNHMSAVTAVCFSNDQSKLVSVSRDKVINTWCLQTFALLHTSPVFEVHLNFISNVSFSLTYCL
jgi:WD40 repeat protein